MADVNVSTLPHNPKGEAKSGPTAAQKAADSRGDEGIPAVELIELLFFAYRDFVGDADEMLARLGFGRAHHRVVHFVNRHPGMRVADLLAVLKITKQSLGRVLRELVDNDYIQQKAGATDRRERLLYVAPKGEELARQLVALQTRRLSRALNECGPGARTAARNFLAAMIDPEARTEVERLISRAADQK
ncbi:MAG TPA: MarR family transcriptional regulator [Xanthobacteraceae bacterium]|nr:MarR family transcriptional regulator [Xanthobacteraceae bacterium]